MLCPTSGGDTSGVPKLTVPSLRADVGGVFRLHRLPLIEANEPCLIHFALCINEDGTEVSVVQVHPDADSIAFAMQMTGEYFARVYEFLDTLRASRSTERPATPSWNRCNRSPCRGFL